MQTIQLRASGKTLSSSRHELQIYRRSYAPRSSWPLVGLALLIVLFAVNGLGL